MLHTCKNELLKSLVFWSNNCGDSVEELPKELQRAYKELWSEDYGVDCYLAEFNGRYSLAFGIDYDGHYSDRYGLSYKEAVGLAEDVAKDLAYRYPEYDVIFGEDAILWSNGERSTIVLVIIPWSVNGEKATELANYMTENGYTFNKQDKKPDSNADFELQYKDEQIADLQATLAGTVTATGAFDRNSHKWEINTSSILTKLIQEAGRWCEYYASDLFIQWMYKVESKLRNGTLRTCSLVFAMRASGVDHREWYEIHKDEPGYYRAVWFLDVKTEENRIEMTLHK